jgi:uncharacterized protein YuzE
MRVTYDPTADAAYVYLVDIGPGEAISQEQVTLRSGAVLTLDFDRDGHLLGLEILGADTLLPPGLKAP